MVCSLVPVSWSEILRVLDKLEHLMLQPVDMLLLQEMTVNDGGFLNAVRDGSCTHVLNLLHGGGVDLEQRDEVRNVGN